MKTKSMMLLAVAVACGLVAMLGVNQLLNKGDDTEKSMMLVATMEINEGEPLNEINTEFREVAVDSMPEGVVTKPEEIVKRALKVPAVPGEPIMLAKLGDEGDIGASVDIPVGMRVVTVAVDLTKSNSGLVRPKDRVDLLVTYKKTDETNRTVSVTKTFMEYVEVFSVDKTRRGNQGEDAGEGAKNFSLLVTPKDAAIIKLAESKGPLTFSMRNRDDDEKIEVVDIEESIFSDARTVAGEREEESEEDEDSNVESFLDEQEETVEVELLPEIEEEIIPPTWNIIIGTGESVETVEVIDEDEFKRLEEERDAKKAERLEQIEKNKDLTLIKNNKKKPVNLFRSAKAWFGRAMPADEITE